MKIRNGFVSNSSSSSFVVVAPKDYKWYENEKIKREYGEHTEEVIELYKKAFRPSIRKCLGQDVEMYTASSDCEPCWNITGLEEFDSLCEKMGYTDNDYELADDLYNMFPDLFDKPECLVYGGD